MRLSDPEVRVYELELQSLRIFCPDFSHASVCASDKLASTCLFVGFICSWAESTIHFKFVLSREENIKIQVTLILTSWCFTSMQASQYEINFFYVVSLHQTLHLHEQKLKSTAPSWAEKTESD